MKFSGVWVPVITPFKNDEVDFVSYKRMIDHYISKGATGILPLGTTGESPTVTQNEYEEIVEKTMEFVNKRTPVIVGLGGNNTKKLTEQVKVLEKYNVDGILSVSPYYSRPDQRGIYNHFKTLAEATTLDIILYNIPYRTGRNMENETIHKLAEIKNIVGIKDACGNFNQTYDLLMNRPKDFTILTGEDNYFYSTLALGGDGGIMASSHLNTEVFMKVYELAKANDFNAALQEWKKVCDIIPLLFAEPNPAPLKYSLKKTGLIDSDEIRLPLMNITEELERKLDKYL